MSSAATSSPFQALYRACIKEAAGHNDELIHAALARALQDMPAQAAQEADAQERQQLAEAAKVLDARHRLLCEGFPPAVLAEMSQAIAGERASGLSFDALPLLGEEELQENVDLTRASQAVLAAVRQPLADLEALLAAAHGVPHAHPQRHPLRPEVYVRGVWRLVNQIPAATGMRRRWLRHVAAGLGPQLARLYEQLAALLRRQGVVASSSAAQPLTEEAGIQMSVRELRRLLAGELEPAAAPTRPNFAETEFSATVPAAFETLREMRQVDQVIQQLRQRHAARPTERNETRAEYRETLQLQVRRPAQALALEVVKLMVDNLARDPRLLEPIQEAVRELEPALLRLALADPRFFSDRMHPARQLLEQVTQRSLAWTAVDAPGFAEFFDAFQQAVEVLLEARATGPEPFAIALETLTEAWSETAPPRSRRSREKAVRALLRAEQRNLLAERIAQQLGEIPEAASAPAPLREFLAGPWAQVMAQARLADSSGTADPGSYGAAASTLLRTVRPQLASRLYPHRQPLAERIRHGLASIDYLPADAHRWMTVIDALQQRAVSAADAALPEAPPRVPGETWLAPMEVHDSGFVPLATALPDTGSPLEQSLPAVDLKPGTWIDLREEGAWARWQLTWASPHGLLFLFTGSGGRTLSMAHLRVQQLLAAGELRLVSSEGVVDGALDAVAQAAWRNTDY